MDVRCEKCQTEYELDESRLKPGGVTVKCTNCGHMFKIRKRSNTNVGVPATAAADPRAKPPSKPGDGAPGRISDLPSGPNSERQWLVRLENGDTKQCKELATLQQWIVAGVVSRESLISRSGKTWKRLGDIPELTQYFVIADEARAQRSAKPTGKPGGAIAATMMGVGKPGGVEEEDELRSTGSYRARQPTPPPPPTVKPQPPRAPTPPVPMPVIQQPATPSKSHSAQAIAQTEVAPSGPIASSTSATQRKPPTPAPPPPAAPRVKPPSDAGRQTAMWADSGVKATDSMVAMPQGPRGGKLSASP